ncbi:MAG: deoxyribonuclease IV [Chloroflexota bacterium]
MLANGRRLGAHLALGAGMVKAADRAAEIGASALQVFSDNPTSWRRRSALPRELPAFLDRLAGHGIAPLAIHAPYLVNLATPDEEVHGRSVALLVNELRVAQDYGAAFLNVHIGSHRGAGVGTGVRRVADGLAQVFAAIGGDAPDPVLVLENGAGGGFGLGMTVEELDRIDNAVADAGVPRDRFGFCLDTAHAWGAGYRIDSAAGVDDLMAAIADGPGTDRFRMVHLNDSKAELGSRADRHEHLGAGGIGTNGIHRIVTHPALEHVTYYLETPGMDEGYDAVNIARLHDIVAGRPLADLPDAAFRARNVKGRSAPADDDAAAQA